MSSILHCTFYEVSVTSLPNAYEKSFKALVYLVKTEFVEYSFDSYLAASNNASDLLYHIRYYNYLSLKALTVDLWKLLEEYLVINDPLATFVQKLEQLLHL